jgi:uncharacterized protein YndB with AHSA1/START domain
MLYDGRSEMKWLLVSGGALVGLVLVGVVVLKILASRPGANHAHITIQINRPPAEVFPWVTEPERLKRWISWLEEVRSIETTPAHVGSKRLLVMNDPNMKRKLEITSEAVAYEPPRHFLVRLTLPQTFSANVDYALSDGALGTTRLDYDTDYTFHNGFAALMSPMVRPRARQKAQMDLATLKRLVESEPALNGSAAATPSP